MLDKFLGLFIEMRHYSWNSDSFLGIRISIVESELHNRNTFRELDRILGIWITFVEF